MFKWMKKTNETATFGDAFMYTFTCYALLFGGWYVYVHFDDIKEAASGKIQTIKTKIFG